MSKHTLLLADDSITIQKVVNLTFADEGIEVICVGDGNSAMERLAEAKPDLVMADINMPGLNGYEICERIKQNEETRTLPVILLVGSFEPFDEDKAKLVGADAFLTKPFSSISQLVKRVSDLLNAGGEGSDTPPGSLDNTLEFEKESTEDLHDAGTDDNMIHADAADVYANDDAQPAEADPPVELDEANLLELPSREYFLASLLAQKASAGEAGATVATIDVETNEAEAEENDVSVGSSEIAESSVSDESSEIAESSVSDAPELPANLSPEMIDAIAARVVEKISDKVIREIAWEVVPQMTDLIVKRMAEERLEE